MDVDHLTGWAHSVAVRRTLLRVAVLAAATAVAPAVAPAALAVPAPAKPVHGVLLGVDGTSARDVWAVGFGSPGTLIEHWNGVSWRVVPSPSPGTGKAGYNDLSGVAAVSPADAWAVGAYESGPGVSDTSGSALIEHWNGKRWRRVSIPVPAQDDAPALAGVAAVSRSDIWAVGTSPTGPLILHWNGTKWAKQSLSGTPEAELTAVSATSATNAWAAGIDIAGDHSVTAHWNGKKWSWVTTPNQGQFNPLYGVTATSGTTAWAVGENAQKNVKIVRWNGTKWSLSANPRITGTLINFYGITAIPHGGLWAVGQRAATSSFVDKTLIARWTGKRWITVASPNYGSADNTLHGVYAPSASSAWAVGGFSALFPVIERWNGKKWQLVTP
jgi:hypothetical protein